MSLSEELVAQVRRDLAGLVANPEVHAALAGLLPAAEPDALRERGFELVTRFVGVRSLGELASRSGADRDDLLRLAADDESARGLVASWVAIVTRPAVFRALAHALPFSFRVELSPALAAHVEGLRRALDEPIWPDVPVSLAQLFVPPAAGEITASPRAARAAAKVSAAPDAPRDALATIRAMLTEPGRQALSVCGPSGVGKSSLAAVIAGREAQAWGYVPVLLHAPELARAREGETSSGLAALQGAGAAGPLLVLVDGFDELGTSSSRTEVLRLVATHLEGAADARAILFGREPIAWRFAQGEVEKALTLEPFDRGRSHAWSERWRAATGREFDVTRFNDAPGELGSPAPPTKLFTGYPVTLFILAVAEQRGKKLPSPRTERGRAALYRVVLDKLAGLSGELPTEEHREVMRAAAVLSHASPRNDAATSDVISWLVGPDARAHRDHAARVSKSLSRFPMTQSAWGVRFVHASIRDHLAAEHLAANASRMLSAARDASDGAVIPPPREGALAAAWVESFGRFPLDAYSLAPLQQMLPDWTAYEQGRNRKASTQRRLGTRLAAVLRAAYRWLVEDLAAEACVGFARAWRERPRRVCATALFNVFALARCVDHPAAQWFAPEQVLPGSLATAWHLIAAELDLTDGMRALMFEPLVLHGLHASSLNRLALEPVDLRDADLTGANFGDAAVARLDLSGAMLSGASLLRTRLDGVSLVRAQLDRVFAAGASFAECDLREADLRGADLRNARFTYCDLRGARFDNADLRGCSLRGSFVRGASFGDVRFDPGVMDDVRQEPDEDPFVS